MINSTEIGCGVLGSILQKYNTQKKVNISVALSRGQANTLTLIFKLAKQKKKAKLSLLVTVAYHYPVYTSTSQLILLFYGGGLDERVVDSINNTDIPGTLDNLYRFDIYRRLSIKTKNREKTG